MSVSRAVKKFKNAKRMEILFGWRVSWFWDSQKTEGVVDLDLQYGGGN